MRKEFVVMRIDAAPDGAPYVLVTLSLAKDMAEEINLQIHLQTLWDFPTWMI